MNLKKYEMDRWDKRFFDLCNLISSWSEDPHRIVGAVIVGSGNQILSTGYNGYPRGVISKEERFSRVNREKFHWSEHAERNALYNAARSGVATEGMTLYSSVFPCSDCARGIIQSGIRRLKTFRAPEKDPSFERGFVVSSIMLEEAGIDVQLFD